MVDGLEVPEAPDSDVETLRDLCFKHDATGAANAVERIASRLAASKRDQERLADAVQRVLLGHHLTNVLDEDDEPLSLIDALCTPGEPTVSSGLHAIDVLRDEIVAAIDAAQGEQPKGSRVAGDHPKEEASQ